MEREHEEPLGAVGEDRSFDHQGGNDGADPAEGGEGSLNVGGAEEHDAFVV